MEKDVISEADDTIVIDVPEQKEYVISIANNSYKIKPIFSIYVYEQLIEDINEENWKNKIAKILQSEINKTGEGRPSIDDILNDQTEPCKKYIKVLLEIIYIFLTIFLYLLKCPQSLILSALRAFCFCGKPHISRSIFLYFRYQAWLKSW